MGRSKYQMPERFWLKLRKAEGSGCWEWTGSKLRHGYGRIWYEGRLVLTHRLAFILVHGPIEGNVQILHRCDNPSCCRPDHLFKGTQLDNMKDCAQKKRNQPPPKGEAHHKAKLREADVIDIRKRVASGASRMDMARKYNLDSSTVSAIVLGDIWAGVGGPRQERKSRNVYQ